MCWVFYGLKKSLCLLLNNMICCRSDQKLKYIQVSTGMLSIFLRCCFSAFDEYRNISQKDIEDSIKGELSGHFEDLLLAIGKPMSAYKLRYFALVLNQCQNQLFPSRNPDWSIFMLPRALSTVHGTHHMLKYCEMDARRCSLFRASFAF